VGAKAVWQWRTAFGIGRDGTEGRKRLIDAACAKGAAVLRGQKRPAEWVERCRRRAAEEDLGKYLRTAYRGDLWTHTERALLGTAPDEVVAASIGRTTNAVRIERNRCGIPSACDHRRAAPFVDTSGGILD
jgi:hypothetical protein